MPRVTGSQRVTVSLPGHLDDANPASIHTLPSDPGICSVPPDSSTKKEAITHDLAHQIRFLSERSIRTESPSCQLRRNNSWPCIDSDTGCIGNLGKPTNRSDYHIYQSFKEHEVSDNAGASSTRGMSNETINLPAPDLEHPLVSDNTTETVSLVSNGNASNLCQLHLSESRASLDTVANLLESLSASEERHSPFLTVDDVILIFSKRMFRHAASSTALADILNYLKHPYYAATVIVTMTSVGVIDGIYKIGEKDRQCASYSLSACRWIHQRLNSIQDFIPDSCKNAFRTLYYNCSLIAAASTVPADLLSHLNDAGHLKTDAVPDIVCPLIIFLPTLFAGLLTCKELMHEQQDSEVISLDAVTVLKLLLQRTIIHATAGTVSADIAVYLGYPDFGVAAILFMGSVGFIDGLFQCGELIQKNHAITRINTQFEEVCRAICRLFDKLESLVPNFFNELIKKTYLYTSITGTTGTIVGDVLAYFGYLNRAVNTKICPMTVTLFTGIGAITSIVPAVINRLAKPITTQTHFLMRDNPVQII